MRAWRTSSPPDLSLWFQGFAMTQPGNHIPARAQEFVIGEACRFNARVALLEACYVRVTLHVGQQMAVPPDSVPVGVTRRVETGASVGETQRWAQLRRSRIERHAHDCMRGRFRQCWGTALRERCRARLAGDVVSESRAWKLLCLSCCCTGHGVQVLWAETSWHRELPISREAGGSSCWTLHPRSLQRDPVRLPSAEEEQKRRGLAAQSRPAPDRS